MCRQVQRVSPMTTGRAIVSRAANLSAIASRRQDDANEYLSEKVVVQSIGCRENASRVQPSPPVFPAAAVVVPSCQLDESMIGGREAILLVLLQ